MRYIIGIDLGTTNSSVAYVDTQSQNLQIHPFRIPQIVGAGYIEDLATLPSFCYISSSEEWPKGSLALPWRERSDYFVGQFAQVHGAKVPTRLVQSAKSWLCQAAADRREKILPFETLDPQSRISPIEATTRYLTHLKESWNYLIAKGDHTQEFEQQEIVLTVPASFDEVARRLTAEAASQTGLTHMTLLEEPQAAFYSWLSQNESNWQSKLPLESYILVCDVGGGTTDFSFIEVAGSAENPILQRMAVGDHLLLGGDNMDAALAHYLEPQMFAEEPTVLQWMQLKGEMRTAKEALLGHAKEIFQVILQGSGASIVGNTRTATLKQDDAMQVLLQGFFGQYPWNEALNIRKTSGMRTMGLPYENEPSITKHLARFLAQSSKNDSSVHSPDFVLFNGGTMKPSLFQEAVIKSLEAWFPKKKVAILPSFNLDLAVARGAAYYGKVRRGIGVKISGGTPRSYYLGLDTKSSAGVVNQALTLLPRGADDGSSFEPEHTFLLRPNAPVSFQLYTSHVRLNDHSGDFIAIDPEELHSLPQINTILRFGKRKQELNQDEMIPVHLAVLLNAIGILEICLKSQKTDHVWALEFQLKSAFGQENALSTLSKDRTDEVFDQKYLDEAKSCLQETFSPKFKIKPPQLMETLEQYLQQPRRAWSPSLLRSLGDVILNLADKRKLTPSHELRWWNLVGFLLLPGYGYPLDDFRMKELWKIILSDSKLPISEECQIQKWICFRRCAGGLNKGQQLQLAHELIALVVNKKNNKIEVKDKSEFHQYAEKIRVLASLELINPALKIKLGDALANRIAEGKAISTDYWALGRLGARHLFYGSNANVLSKEVCVRWLKLMMSGSINNFKEFSFMLCQLARKTEHREINLPKDNIEEILNYASLKSELKEELPHLQKTLLEVTQMTSHEQERIFGDHLPTGLVFWQDSN